MITVEEIGRPIEPLNSGASKRLMHAAGEVSVRPHACVSVLPVTCFQRSATARCTAMPPPRLTLSALKSTWSKPGVLSSALNSVFTPLKNVNLYFDSSLTKPGKSRGLAISTLCAPSFMNSRQFAVSEKMWYSGSAVTRIIWPLASRSDGPIHASDCSTLATMLRWVSTAPFDTPVVPPVYCRNAMSSWPSGTGSRFSNLPLLSASLKPIAPGSEYSGTCFLTWRSTKFTSGPFGNPSRSPMPVTITVSTPVS